MGPTNWWDCYINSLEKASCDISWGGFGSHCLWKKSWTVEVTIPCCAIHQVIPLCLIFSRLHQMAKLYLFGPSSGLYSCPLAMTDGGARLLEVIERLCVHLCGCVPIYVHVVKRLVMVSICLWTTFSFSRSSQQIPFLKRLPARNSWPISLLFFFAWTTLSYFSCPSWFSTVLLLWASGSNF